MWVLRASRAQLARSVKTTLANLSGLLHRAPCFHVVISTNDVDNPGSTLSLLSPKLIRSCSGSGSALAIGEPSIVVRALTLSLVSLLLAMDLAKGGGENANQLRLLFLVHYFGAISGQSVQLSPRSRRRRRNYEGHCNC